MEETSVTLTLSEKGYSVLLFL